MPDLTLNRNENGRNDMLNNDPAKKNLLSSSVLTITGH